MDILLVSPGEFWTERIMCCWLHGIGICLICKFLGHMTPHQVKEALRRRNNVKPMRSIAKTYNVSNGTMAGVVDGLPEAGSQAPPCQARWQTDR